MDIFLAFRMKAKNFNRLRRIKIYLNPMTLIENVMLLPLVYFECFFSLSGEIEFHHFRLEGDEK